MKRIPGLRSIASLILVVAMIGAAPPVASAAAQHRYANMYAFWDFGGATGFWNVDQHVAIARKARYSFWAQRWSWTNPSTTSGGGYIGLQTDGNRFNGTTGDTAIFSLWGANAASGPACGKFANEGTGLSCRLPFTITTGRLYRLRVWRLTPDSKGQWWGGWIKDESTGRETYLGKLRVASAHRYMAPPDNFSEYLGPATSCHKVPTSIAYWTQPAAHHLGGGVYEYGSTYSSWHLGECTGGSATPIDFGWTMGVRMLLGGGPTIAPTL